MVNNSPSQNDNENKNKDSRRKTMSSNAMIFIVLIAILGAIYYYINYYHKSTSINNNIEHGNNPIALVPNTNYKIEQTNLYK